MNVKYNKKKSLKFILNYSVMFSVISKKDVMPALKNEF